MSPRELINACGALLAALKHGARSDPEWTGGERRLCTRGLVWMNNRSGGTPWSGVGGSDERQGCRRRPQCPPALLAGDGRSDPTHTRMRVSRPTTGNALGNVRKETKVANCQRCSGCSEVESSPWNRAPRSYPPAAGDEGTVIDRSPHRGPCVGGPHAPPPPRSIRQPVDNSAHPRPRGREDADNR